MSVPILRLPDLNNGFTLRTVASNVVTCAFLVHETNEIKFPIAYASKKLLPREPDTQT